MTGLILIGLILHFIVFICTVPMTPGLTLGAAYLQVWHGYFTPSPIPSPGAANPIPAPASSTPTPATPAKPATPTLAPPNLAAEDAFLVYLPLATGNSWEYQTTEHRLGGPAPALRTLRLRCDQVEIAPDRHYYHVHLESQEAVYFVAGDELRMAREAGQTGSLKLMYPLDRGTSWISQPESVYYTNEGTEQLETPLGTFECLRIDYAPSAVEGEKGSIWYARDLGLVRQEIRLTAGKSTITDLVGFNVNGRLGGSMAATPTP
ncbi:MAG: hypothetical protein ABI743_07785 [bacterium]